MCVVCRSDPGRGDREATTFMDYEAEIADLERDWDLDTGFFWRIREGHFVPAEFERALARISRLNLGDEVSIPRRLVALLWYLPLFMEWQVDRVRQQRGDVEAYRLAITRMTNELERLLGVP